MAMANLRGVGAFLAGNNRGSNLQPRSVEDIVKQGILRKRKKNKNTKELYFVLRKETSRDLPSRLEIYDSENKFKEGAHPKKKYILKDFFSINKITDASNKDIIALYIKNKKDYVALVAQSEPEMQEWLKVLQQHKNDGSENAEGNVRIEYEHVWVVEVQPRSFANKQNLAGHQLACLTNTLLTLVRIENANKKTECYLHTIRKCGHVNQFFFVELGRFSPIGCGTLWMKAADPVIAQNMHQIVGDAMNKIGSSEGSEARERAKSLSHSQREGSLNPPRNRSDSVPASAKGQGQYNHEISRNPSDPARYGQSSRPQSMYDSYMFSQSQFGSPGSTESFSSEEEHHTPECEYNDISEYVVMNENKDSCNTFHPKTLSIHNISGTSSGSACTPQGTSTPVSPSGGNSYWTSQFRNHLPSPHGSSGSHSAAHSRSSSLVDDSCDGYIPMLPPVSSSNSLSPAPPQTSCSPSHYLEMGPGLSSMERRTASTPTPIPASPSDCDSYHEMSPNSGSSSFTSGTPSSDQRIHDLIGERACSSGCGLGPNYSCGEDSDLIEMRPIRTNSVGSKPEQFKRKNSAPMLDISPVSHSWSGTPGSYFRGIIQNRNIPRQKDLVRMELDFSHNKSYDFIPSEEREKERKTSKERLWHTFTAYRQRSNSKSSGGSTSRVNGGDSSREKKLSESEICGRGVEIPSSCDRNEYFELDFNPSPRSNASDSSKGYLPMHPPSSAFLSSIYNGSDCGSKRGPRHSSANDAYHEMSSSLSSCASQDGYVDMTQGISTSVLTIASSSSSTSSVNCSTSVNRKISNILNPVSSQDLPSPMEDFMDMDLNSEGGDPSQKKVGKKGSKRKSFKESAKRKKSDSGTFTGRLDEADCTEVSQKSKASGPFSTLTNLISRKPSTSKAPLSPLGSPVAKSAKESSSPFSSLKRSKSREVTDFAINHEVPEESDVVDSISDCHRRMCSLSSDLSTSPPALERKQLSSSMDMTAQFGIVKGEEKMLLSPSETGKLLWQKNNIVEAGSGEKRISAYVNLDLSDETTSSSLPSLNLFQKSQKSMIDTGNYMNMLPGSSSPQLSPPAKKEKPSPSIEEETISDPPSTSFIVPNEEESSYMLMGDIDKQKSPVLPYSAPIVTRRPHIPQKLLAGRAYPPSLGLEKLAINEQALSSSSERSRSHSGPGASERGIGNKSVKNNHESDARAASACSSPISYSPPTSPMLGSVSSMSSLSEGGLSSASSTCTVVNVGVQRLGCVVVSSKGNVVSPECSTSVVESLCSQNPSESKNTSEEDDALNYACLDLGITETKDTPSTQINSKNGVVDISSSEEKSQNYVAIDFAKSEQFKNIPQPPH